MSVFVFLLLGFVFLFFGGEILVRGSVSLSPEGEVDVLVQNISRQRSMVQAQRYYKIGGTDAQPIVGEVTEDKLAAGWEKFMSQGGLGTRAPNDKRTNNS